MIEAIIDDEAKLTFTTFPRLMISNTSKNIVLITGENCSVENGYDRLIGTIIALGEGNSGHKIGEYSNNWLRSALCNFQGSCLLQNKPDPLL